MNGTQRLASTLVAGSLWILVSEACLAKTERNSPAIDPKMVAKYEALGAFYGGFVVREEKMEFEAGEEAANSGLPGFCWFRLPEGPFPELPQVDRDFGVWIKATTGEFDVRKLTHLKNLHTLILDSQKLTEGSVKELTKIEHLRSLTLTSAKISAEDIGGLSNLQNIEVLTISLSNLNGHPLRELKSFKKLKSFTLTSKLKWASPTAHPKRMEERHSNSENDCCHTLIPKRECREIIMRIPRAFRHNHLLGPFVV